MELVDVANFAAFIASVLVIAFAVDGSYPRFFCMEARVFASVLMGFAFCLYFQGMQRIVYFLVGYLVSYLILQWFVELFGTTE